MNIFILDENPKQAAVYMCDKHIRSKMIIESAIALQSCFSQETLSKPDCPRTKSGRIRKSRGGYANHPCSVWARSTSKNFEWLLDHVIEMCDERKRRWKSTDHFTESFIKWVINNKQNIDVKPGELTPFAVAIKDGSKCKSIKEFNSLSTVEKYRLYYIYDKPFATWTNVNKPTWMNKPNGFIQTI